MSINSSTLKTHNFIERMKNLSASLSEKNAKDYLSKKHEIRANFYRLLIDYIRSPGESNPLLFFRWMLTMLDARAQKSPHPIRMIRAATKSKNQSTLRKILEQCDAHRHKEPDFNKIIQPYLPDDEFRIISNASKADITGELESAEAMALDKKMASDLKKDAIMSNIPVIVVAFILHIVIYNELYSGSVRGNYMDKLTYGEMSILQQGHYHYYVIVHYWYAVIAGVVGLFAYVNWLISNWHKRAMYLRENIINYIPPFSIAKIAEQYSLVLVVANSMKAGINFYDALESAKLGASKYTIRQINLILSRSHLPAHVAMDTQFMGEFGSMIKERGESVKIDVAMASLIEPIREIKNKKLTQAVNMSVKTTIRPLVILSVAAGIGPYLTDMIMNVVTMTSTI